MEERAGANTQVCLTCLFAPAQVAVSVQPSRYSMYISEEKVKPLRKAAASTCFLPGI